ncbi:hypothetical protein HHK36_012134 [Tetracentron sinense]|uniref:SWIM-type domain-containing protein n=1 Tax=Tetracentron sinense TaxID=13715 RepID=A0A834Z869_TETSI|nr:hypothetical protein HHK36_012134 [Tetracentron sinense]
MGTVVPRGAARLFSRADLCGASGTDLDLNLQARLSVRADLCGASGTDLDLNLQARLSVRADLCGASGTDLDLNLQARLSVRLAAVHGSAVLEAMASETVALDRSADEQVEKKVNEEIKTIKEEGVPPSKENEGNDEEEKLKSDVASQVAPVIKSKENMEDNQIESLVTLEIEKVDGAPGLDVPDEDNSNLVENSGPEPIISSVPEPYKQPEEQPQIGIVEKQPEDQLTSEPVEKKTEEQPAIEAVEKQPEEQPRIEAVEKQLEEQLAIEAVEKQSEEKPAIEAVEKQPEEQPARETVEKQPEEQPAIEAVEKQPEEQLALEDVEKQPEEQRAIEDVEKQPEEQPPIEDVKEQQEEKPKKLDVPESSIEAFEKPAEHSDISPVEELEPEVAKEPEVSGTESKVVQKPNPVTEMEEQSQEQPEVIEEVQEKSEDVEPKNNLEGKIMKDEETSANRVQGNKSLNEELSSKDQQPVASESLNQVVSPIQEAQADPKKGGDSSLPDVDEQAGVEDTKKEESGIDLVEGLSKEAIPKAVKDEETEEKIVKIEEENEEKNAKIEESDQPETIQIEDVSGSHFAKEVTEKSFEGEKTSRDVEVGTEEKESVKDDIPASVETNKDRDIEGKVDEVNTTTTTTVGESVGVPKESELEATADKTTDTDVDMSEKAKEEVEEISKSDAPNLESSKDGADPPKQEVPTKPTQKQSTNIISKVKKSIVKVKKAISKTLSSETKEVLAIFLFTMGLACVMANRCIYKVMAKGKLIVICQSGGKFNQNDDGSLLYTGGDAHAMSVSKETRYDEFKSELADMWKYESNSMTIKYFLPNNKRTLITISSDKDMQHMMNFHEDSATVDVYVMTGEDVAHYVSNMPCSRSSWPMVAEPVTPVTAPTANVADADDIRQQKLTRLWGNSITGLNQQFDSVQDLSDALHKYSIAHGFAYTCKTIKDKFVRVYCKAEGCPWRINAGKLSTTHIFIIKKMNGTHTCGVGTGTASRPQPTVKLVASIVKEKLRDMPNYKTHEIANEIRQDLGLELKYSRLYRGMEAAREELQGSYKEAYNQLPWLCEKLVETNPGSVATLITRDDLSFHRLFVAFHASLCGFRNGCRPLLFLDAITLNSRYQEEMLTATAVDGNDGIFPVAFAIVDVLNDDNWHWFLEQLKTVVSTSQSITFVADRQKGIRESISEFFENCYHGFCLHHLSENLRNDLKRLVPQEVVRMVVPQFYDAVYAPTLEGFRKCIESIKGISPEASEWILQAEPEHWANAFFRGERYNHVRSDIAKPFYSWVSETQELQIVQLIDTMRRKMMELIYTRRVDSEQWSTRLTPCSEEKLQKETLRARSLEVLFSPTSRFEVRDDSDAINVVNIDHRDCSCRGWQITGLPCLHTLAVFEHIGRSIYDYCFKYFMRETYQLTYSESINPVPTADRPMHGNSSPVQVQPPSVRRKRGRPKERRNGSQDVDRKSVRCSRLVIFDFFHDFISCPQFMSILEKWRDFHFKIRDLFFVLGSYDLYCLTEKLLLIFFSSSNASICE